MKSDIDPWEDPRPVRVPVVPEAVKGAAVEAILALRAAQGFLGGEKRFRGKGLTAERCERAAASLYRAIDEAEGRPWVECEACGEVVRTLKAHREGCIADGPFDQP